MSEHCAAMTYDMDAFIQPFFLNGFSFAAGYVYLHRPGFGSMMKKKTRQLLIPWFIFSMFIVVSSYIISFSDKHTSLMHDIVMNLLQIHYNGDHMWYIAALFLSFVPFYFFIAAYEASALSIAGKNTVFILAAFLLSALSLAFSTFVPASIFPWSSPAAHSALPWHLEYIFQAMFFMFLGYIFKQSWETHCSALDRPIVAFVLFAVYIVSVYAPSIFRFAFSPFGSYLISYPRAFLGVAAIVSISRCLPASRFSDFLGQSTLAYYGLHGKVYSLLGVVGMRFIPKFWISACYGTEIQHIIGTIVIVMFTAVLLIIPTMIINRFFPFAVGKMRKKNI